MEDLVLLIELDETCGTGRKFEGILLDFRSISGNSKRT
jgi:hypothetical protein